MKKFKEFLRLLIAISIIIPSNLKAQVHTLEEFRSELESQWDLRDSNYQAYAREDLERFLSDKCREGYHPFDLLNSMEMRLFTKESGQEYRELTDSLKSDGVPAHEVDNRIKSFVDKYFNTKKSTSFVVTEVTYYIYKNQCDITDSFNDLKPMTNSDSHHRSEPPVNEASYLIPRPLQNYHVIDFFEGVTSLSAFEDPKSSDGSVLQMATMMPPGLTITMELTGMVVTLFPVGHPVKLAEHVE